jgi:hypothetical protein
MAELFDQSLRSMRRDRAARVGVEPFLFKRVFDDCLERIALVQRRFASALLVGSPVPDWPMRLNSVADAVEVVDPGALFALASGGSQACEDDWQPAPGSYDLVLAIGTLDTVNDLPGVLGHFRFAMRSDALLIGAMAGADTLPQLRAAMLAADRLSGVARPHVHPRIEAAAVAPLLDAAGFARPVVDVERIAVSYPSLARLVDDLRRMAGTNLLVGRPGSLSRRGYAAAAKAFAAAGDGTRTTETVEIIHFAAWIGRAAPPADLQ